MSITWDKERSQAYDSSINMLSGDASNGDSPACRTRDASSSCKKAIRSFVLLVRSVISDAVVMMCTLEVVNRGGIQQQLGATTIGLAAVNEVRVTTVWGYLVRGAVETLHWS